MPNIFQINKKCKKNGYFAFFCLKKKEIGLLSVMYNIVRRFTNVSH